MAGLLGDIYSASNTLKRKVNGLLSDPMGTAQQFVGQLGDDTNTNINNMLVGHGLFGNKSVLTTPQQAQAARSALADYGAQSGMAGMFVGKGSKTWDAISAKKAEQMAAQGVDPRKVWSETGTWKGPDGAWRQEIDDSRLGMRLKGPKFGTEPMNKIGDAVDHRDLFVAYPDTKNINVTWNQTKGSGSYTAPRTYAEYIDVPQVMGQGAAAKPEALNSATAHELQHAIQQREGWARGGNPESAAMEDVQEINKKLSWIAKEKDSINEMQFSSGVDPKAVKDQLRQLDEMYRGALNDRANIDHFGTYKKLAGEAEARATQARIPLDASQRRALFPEDSYDVPMNQLIVRGLLGK